MSWKVLQLNSKLRYDAAKEQVDFSNVYYHYFIYDLKEKEIALKFDVAVVEETYFLSALDALINSLGGINRLIKIVFFDSATGKSFLDQAKKSGVVLPAHAEAVLDKGSIFDTGYMIPKIVETIAETVFKTTDKVTDSLGIPSVRDISKILVGAGVIFLGIFLYKTYKSK